MPGPKGSTRALRRRSDGVLVPIQARRARDHDDVAGMLVPVVGGEHQRWPPFVQAHPVEAAPAGRLHLSGSVDAAIAALRGRRYGAAARPPKTPMRSLPLPAGLRP